VKEPLAKLSGHGGPVSALAFSPDGQFLASGGSDQVVKVWNVQSRHEVRTYRGHGDWVTAVAFGPDGRSIVSGAADKLVLLWRFQADEGDGGFGGHGRQVKAVAVSGDGRLFASASEDRTVKLWDPAAGAERRTLAGHAGGLTAVAVAPDGKRVLTAGDDRRIRAWDAVTGREVQVHEGNDEVLLLAYQADGSRFLAWQRRRGSGDDDVTTTVQQYDAATLKPLEALSDRLSADGALVAMGSSDGSVRLWEFAKKERVGGDRPASAKALWDLALTPDKKTLITADHEGEVKVAPLAKAAGPGRTFKSAAAVLDGLAVSPDGARLATFGGGRVELWDVATGKALRSWQTPSGVKALAFTPDGKHLLTGNDDSTLYLLELP
jgi:WD40 repeat protein